MSNVITANFSGCQNTAWTDAAYQYDYGQVLQFEGLDLPDAYEVHFSNVPMSGNTITQIGGADGVTIPDQFFLSGETVYAWVYLHTGDDDGETVYMVTIPVNKRPQPSDDVPTPVEQSAIDQAIAALNIAVEKSEAAIEHYPQIQNGTWHVWDVTTEAWVDTGVQAQGQPGQDGVSPVITVTDITGGHRVTITDAEGTQTVDVMNGQPGDDGYSPTVTVTEITGGHRVTITDAQGDHVFDVMDGQDGSVTVDDELSTTSENPVQNKVITNALAQTNEDITDLQTAVDGKVDDVQVNGTSVVQDGVANIPKASSSESGTVKVNGNGLTMFNNGEIAISPASSTWIKNATDTRAPVTPLKQHEAVFYGMAKAASDTTQSASSNPVGTYTDAAKIAIQKMLGIYEAPWELIADVTTSEDLASVAIETDTNGESFALKKGLVYVEAPRTTTGTRDSITAQGSGYDKNGVSHQMNFPNMQWYGSTSPTLFNYKFECNGVSPQPTSGVAASGYGSTAPYTQNADYINEDAIACLWRFILYRYNSTSSYIPSGTRVRIYGQRYVQ